MPRYNLIDDLDAEEQKPQPPAESEENQESPADPDETKLSDFIVEDVIISEPEMKPVENDEVVVEKNDVPDDFTDQQKFTVPDGTPPMQPYDLGTEFEDEKQPGINFKPFLIGFGIIAVLAIIYFAVDQLFLSGEDVPETEVVTETAEEKMRRVQEEQKQRLLLNHSTINKHHLSYLSALTEINKGDVTYSSFLLYDNTLNFEVFASNRDKLAQFNMLLKTNNKVKNYSIETSVTRPGSKGGVFALYNVAMTPPPTAPSGGSVTSTSPSNWVSTTTSQFGLSLLSQRQISNRSEGTFSVSRNEFIFEGSQANCNRVVSQLASQNYNLKIYKLMLLPRDQRLMSKAAYELRLIIDFYL